MNENQTEEELEKEIEEEKTASFFQTVPQRMDEEDPDNVLKRIEVNLEILSEKVTAAEDSRAMYESMVEFYNSFNATAKKLEENLNKEFNYTRFLQSEIDKKKYHLDYLALKKNLAEDRAQMNGIMEKINETLDLRLKDIDNRERSSNESFDSKLQTMDKKVEDFVNIETRIEENLKGFRTDMTKASENEYKILAGKCRESIVENTKKVDEIKSAVISFLKSCEKQNEQLIKKVPAAKFKFEWRDYAIVGLAFVWFVGMIVQNFVK